MRIVELERDTTTLPFQVIRVTGYVAAVFSLIVCVLMIANNLSVKRLDPIHSPALTNLVSRLKSTPRDEALREEIRELDYLTRKAFFTSQHFNRTGICLLVGGLAVMVISFKALRSYQPAPPYPDSRDPKEDPAANALWARRSVTRVGLVLIGFALVLALPWHSPLDEQESTGEGLLPSAIDETVTFPSIEERAQQWPGFLGAQSGRSRGTGIPVDWNIEDGSGVRWRVEVPLGGMNSPVVWGNRVFLSGADKMTREVYCFDADSGELLWRRGLRSAAGESSESVEVMEDTGYAASTVATDGSHVFAIFANGDLAAFGFDGEPLWQLNLGLPKSVYGYSSSLVTFEDLVIVQFDREQDSFITGIENTTGNTRWRTPRDGGPSWSSPQLIHTPSGPQIIAAAEPDVISYDPWSGDELWRVECLEGGEVAVSPSYAEGVTFVAAEYVNLVAIDAVTQQILWEADEAIPGISTPLIVNGLMFFGLAEGGIVCLDANTGAMLWETETDEGIYASPVLVEDRVYLVDRGGIVHIFVADGTGFQSLGSPRVGEEVYSTPAIVGEGLFVHGMKHLFRFGP